MFLHMLSGTADVNYVADVANHLADVDCLIKCMLYLYPFCLSLSGNDLISFDFWFTALIVTVM